MDRFLSATPSASFKWLWCDPFIWALVSVACVCAVGVTAVAQHALAIWVLLLLVAAAAGLIAVGFWRSEVIGGRFLAELQAAHAEVSGMLESAMDPIISIDSHQNVVVFNAAAERAFGWTRAQILGRPLDELIPERYHSTHASLVSTFGTTGTTTRRMGGRTVLMARHVSGTEFPIDASISQNGVGDRKRYTVILRDVSERVERELELKRSKEELNILANAANNSREQEKTRIARELHDELAQSLTAMKIDIAWIRQRLPESTTAIAAKLKGVEAVLDQTVTATRRIAADLRPMLLDDLGLLAALEWLIDQFIERNNIQCEADLSIPDALPEAHATAIFRIVQECLTNITRYAEASRVSVQVKFDASNLSLLVEDDGRGFESGTSPQIRTFGLLGIKERSYMLGGQVSIDSSVGRGTRISVLLPLVMEGLTS